MSQSEILELINENWIKLGAKWMKGILQTDLKNHSAIKDDATISSIKGLLKWNKIQRVRVKLTKTSWTYAILPASNITIFK